MLDTPYNFVDGPQAPNERQKKSGIEDQFEARNTSFFFLLLQVYRILLSVKSTDHVTPIPLDVQEAGAEELAEPWMAKLDDFVRECLRPTDKVAQASTAAEVRKAFFNACDNLLQEREVKLELSVEGFRESTRAATHLREDGKLG